MTSPETRPQVIRCATDDDVRSQLLRVIQESADGARERPVITVGLSGGSLVDTLSRVLPKVNTDWSKWRFFFCDERLVPFSDPESTYGLFMDKFLKENDFVSKDQFVAIDPELDGQESAEDYTSKLKQIFGGSQLPRFDLLLLGMGPDGHTASLFPNHSILSESSLWVAFIADSPKPPPRRITLTLPVINNALCCVFVATGASKATVLKDILEDGKPLPAALVKPRDGRLVWILDSESARLLSTNH